MTVVFDYANTAATERMWSYTVGISKRGRKDRSRKIHRYLLSSDHFLKFALFEPQCAVNPSTALTREHNNSAGVIPFC